MPTAFWQTTKHPLNQPLKWLAKQSIMPTALIYSKFPALQAGCSLDLSTGQIPNARPSRRDDPYPSQSF